MSYILDALRKSDQQRQRGTAPTLQMAQPAALAPNQPAYLAYGLLAALLLGAGILIGWLRPWQAEQPAVVAKVVAAKPPQASVRQQVQTEIAPAPASAPATVPAPAPALPRAAAPSAAPAAPAPARTAPTPVRPPALARAQPQGPASAKADSQGKRQEAVAAARKKEAALPEQPPGTAVPAQNVIAQSELPIALQEELPPMTIFVHAYSGRPADRMVGINSRMLREGDSVAPGLKLELITPDCMVFNYKGYNFRRGVK